MVGDRRFEHAFVVYDIAGNVTFGLFMIDGTEPIFIKKTVSSSTNYEIVNSSCTVAVNDEAEVSINWGDFKAIILQNYIQNYK